MTKGIQFQLNTTTRAEFQLALSPDNVTYTPDPTTVVGRTAPNNQIIGTYLLTIAGPRYLQLRNCSNANVTLGTSTGGGAPVLVYQLVILQLK